MRRAASVRFLVQWVLANAVGWAVGFRGMSFVLTTFDPPAFHGFPRVAAYLVGVVVVAVLQLVVLRKYINRQALWILLTLGGLALSIVALLAIGGTLESALMEHDEDLVGIALALSITFYGLGAIIGAVQWLHLRQQYLEAGWWIPANGVGWATGALVVLAVGLIGDGGSEWLAYAMGGAMTGTISGYFLLQLLRRPLTPTTA